MQLKFTRSKSEKGMMKKVWHFEVQAVLQATPAEREALERYDCLNDKITDLASVRASDTDVCYLKLRNVTPGQLLAGQTFSDTNLSAMLEIEEAIKEGCVIAQAYCYRGDSFDGNQKVYEVTGAKAELVASA